MSNRQSQRTGYPATNLPTTLMLPPRDFGAEQALIAACILFPEKMDPASRIVRSGDFWDERNRKAFAALLRMQADRRPIEDSVLVAAEMEKQWDHECFGEPEVYLRKTMESVGIGANAEYYAEIVAEMSQRRKILYAVTDVERLLHDPGTEMSEIWARLKAVEPNPVDEFLIGMTSEELAAADVNVTYLAENLIVRGQPGGIFGGKKCLKTTVAIAIALRLSVGGMLFEQFMVPRAVRVGVLSGESGIGTIQETARRIANSMDWDLDRLKNVIWEFRLPSLDNPEHLRALERFVKRHSIEFLILDPTYLMLPLGDGAGNLFIVGALLKRLTELGQETGCTVFLVHHTKNRSGDKQFVHPELEDISWSGFQEWVRQWVLLGRRSNYDPEQGGVHQLWMNVGGSAGHSGLWAIDAREGTRADEGGRHWDVEIVPPSQARQNAAVAAAEVREERKEQREIALHQRNRNKLLEKLERLPHGESRSVLKTLSGLRTPACNQICDELLVEGVAQECEIQKNGRCYPGIRLTRDNSGQLGKNGSAPTGPGLD